MTLVCQVVRDMSCRKLSPVLQKRVDGILVSLILSSVVSAHQKAYLVEIEGYIYMVPFVEKDKKEIFLKTIFPSRKLTKKYLKRDKNHE